MHPVLKYYKKSFTSDNHLSRQNNCCYFQLPANLLTSVTCTVCSLLIRGQTKSLTVHVESPESSEATLSPFSKQVTRVSGTFRTTCVAACVLLNLFPPKYDRPAAPRIRSLSVKPQSCRRAAENTTTRAAAAIVSVLDCRKG